MNRRPYARKALDPIHVAAIRVGERPTVLASAGTLLNASATGLLIRVNWRALNPAMVQSNGALAVPQGTLMRMHIVEMALDMERGAGAHGPDRPRVVGHRHGFHGECPDVLARVPGRSLAKRG
jgi:hypothetical protein